MNYGIEDIKNMSEVQRWEIILETYLFNVKSGYNFNNELTLELLKNWYNVEKEIQELYDYNPNAAPDKIYIKKKQINPHILFSANIEELPDGTKQFYLMRFLNKDGNIIYSKIGTTIRRVSKRAEEHLKYYQKQGVTDIIIDRVYDCGVIPCDAYESHFRDYFILLYPDKYVANDRFKEIAFDLKKVDKEIKKYRRRIKRQ